MNKFFSKLGIWEYCFVGFCEMLTSAIAPPYLRHSSAPGAEDGGCKGRVAEPLWWKRVGAP